MMMRMKNRIIAAAMLSNSSKDYRPRQPMNSETVKLFAQRHGL